MRVRESGMPEQSYWESLIDACGLLEEMEISPKVGVFEFGVGYGSFLKCFKNKHTRVAGIDIDQTMVDATRARLLQLGIESEIRCGDFFDNGLRESVGVFDVCLLMNILHHAKPEELVSAACRILSADGRIGMCHWRDDMETPRGPPQEMRIGLAEAEALFESCGLDVVKAANSTRSSYHYFVVATHAGRSIRP